MMISIRNLSKKFGDHIIFDNYSLDVDKGEYVAIVGPSGKGKTTLLNMMGLLEKQNSGTITIAGVTNPNLDSHKGRELLRNKMSYVFQNYGLIDNETVRYNLKIATRFINRTKEQEEEAIKSVLNKVGLPGFERKKIYELSGGEQQRVALARIILKPSELVLADEPTGSLDAFNRDMVLSILRELNERGRTIVVVTHDDVVKHQAKRVVEL